MFEYPIKDKISKKTYQMMLYLLNESEETDKEHGFQLCSNNELVSGDVCIGTVCQIKIDKPCPLLSHIQGNFHTHPSYSTKGTPHASYGDLANALHNRYYKKTHGTTCMTHTNLPDDLNCYTVKEVPNYIMLKDIIDKYPGPAPAPPLLLSFFNKENIDINEQLKPKPETKPKPVTYGNMLKIAHRPPIVYKPLKSQKTHDEYGKYIPKSKR